MDSMVSSIIQVGFFHSDPHPGNLLRPHDQSKARLYLIDFGLVAQVRQEDMDSMGSSIIHLANKDYPALVDDFINLKILPTDCNRAKVVPLMDKALTPYVKGGGAKRYEAELKSMYGMDGSMDSTVGGFQAMTTDMLTVLNDIPFSIPPYFALLARAVVTLEGIALTADPDYGLVLEAYPFVARKLMSEDRPELQQALQQVLYGGGAGGMTGKVTPTRLASLLNSAAGLVAKQEGAVFIDLDAVPEEGLSLEQGLTFVLSPKAASLRTLLGTEAATAAQPARCARALPPAVARVAGRGTRRIPRARGRARGARPQAQPRGGDLRPLAHRPLPLDARARGGRARRRRPRHLAAAHPAHPPRLRRLRAARRSRRPAGAGRRPAARGRAHAAARPLPPALQPAARAARHGRGRRRRGRGRLAGQHRRGQHRRRRPHR